MNSNKKILQKVKELETYSNLDLTELKDMLEDNIREEAVKKCKRSKSELSIIKSLFKDKFYKVKEDLKNKTFLDENGFYEYMTSYRVFYTKTDLGYEVVDKADYNFNNFHFIDDYATLDFVDIEIDIEDLQAFIDMQDKRDIKPYIIELNEYDCVLGVNPKYLMDSIKFTNNNIIKVVPNKSRNGKCINIPIYNGGIDDNGELNKLAVTSPICIQ